ncbi:MAG TPA: TetR/AcrR family transcriptional regulator [Spirochaetota bacterium]|nr:TetR/AcrR family transcriptional regulator [Spirochaetota bacterium]
MKTVSRRQKEIMEAALDIMSAHGIQRLTVKNLARALKVTEPALYRHFKSKQDMLLSILSWYGEFFAGIVKKAGNTGPGAIDGIGALYGEMFRAFVERPALSMVLFSEDIFRYDARLSREVAGIIDMTHDAIGGMLREGIRRGEIRKDVPSRQMSWMVMGTMRLVVTKWRISGYALDLAGEGRKAFSFMKKVLEK